MSSSNVGDIQAFFAARAAGWDERYAVDGDQFARAIRELAPGIGATVLDLGCGTGREESKFNVAHLTLASALKIQTPLLADCPVNIECTIEQEIELDSHTMFIGRVQVVQARAGRPGRTFA